MNSEAEKGMKERLFAMMVPVVAVIAGTTVLAVNAYPKMNPWKKEYEHYLTVINYQIENDTVSTEKLSESNQDVENQKKEIMLDFMEAIQQFVEVCDGNRSCNMEETYRMAVFMQREAYYRYFGPYRYTGNYKNVPDELEDFWKTAGRGIEHIDQEVHLLREEFDGIADEKAIDDCKSLAWEEEFYHCTDVIRKDIEQSDEPDKESKINALEAYEDFIRVWGECNKEYKEIEPDPYGDSIAIGKMDVFCLGTVILIDRYQEAGGEYEFIYDNEKDRQKLLDMYGEE